MKRSYLFLSLILLIYSCDKKEEYFNYLTYITAGQENGLGIRYLDIEPDDTLTIIDYPDTLEVIKSLDLNNDNTPDFEFKYQISSPYQLGASSGGLRIIPLGMNSVCVSKEESHWVDSLHYNDTINENISWSDSTALLYSHTWVIDGSEYTYGYWFQRSDLYVGVKIIKGENSFYGWIDLKNNVIRQFAITIPY